MPPGFDNNVDPDAYAAAGYLRVASLAVAAFDFLQTLPAARRIYLEQRNSSRILISCLLFFLIQLSSILVLVISNVGFFYHGFTDESCKHFYIVPPALKVFQALVSQLILGVRAYNLSQRSRRTGFIVVALFVSCGVVQGLTSLHGRKPMPVDHDNGLRLCQPSAPVENFAPWIFYAVAMIYDLSTTIISMYYLLKHHITSSSDLMTKLTRMMLYDGIGYLFALTAANILNIVIYRANNGLIRTSAASLGYTATWIMTQRLLIHLNKASRNRRNEDIQQAVTITQHLETSRQVSRALRSQFDRKGGMAYDLTVPDFGLDTIEEGRVIEDVEGSVEVRVERTVQVNHRVKTYELENYSRPSTARSSSGV